VTLTSQACSQLNKQCHSVELDVSLDRQLAPVAVNPDGLRGADQAQLIARNPNHISRISRSVVTTNASAVMV